MDPIRRGDVSCIGNEVKPVDRDIVIDGTLQMHRSNDILEIDSLSERGCIRRRVNGNRIIAKRHGGGSLQGLEHNPLFGVLTGHIDDVVRQIDE